MSNCLLDCILVRIEERDFCHFFFSFSDFVVGSDQCRSYNVVPGGEAKFVSEGNKICRFGLVFT